MSSFSTLPEPSPAPFHDVHSFLANDTDDDDADTASQRSISLSSPPDSRRQSTLDEVPLQTTDFHSTFFNKRAAYEDSEDSSSMSLHSINDTPISSVSPSLNEDHHDQNIPASNTTYPPLPSRGEDRSSVSSGASIASRKTRPESLIVNVKNGPIIHGVALVDFNHLIGPRIEYSRGQLYDDEEVSKILPFLALPDGAHLSAEDYSYFHLVPSGPKPSTIFGISCNQQIAASALLVKQPDVTRSTVQKAVVVLASKPVFGPIRDKLGVVTTALFNQRDFTDASILDDFAGSLELSLKSQLTESGFYMGTSLREFVHVFRHRTLILVKAMMLQQRIMFYGHPVERLCTYQYSLVSLIPGLLHTLDDCGSPQLAARAPTLSAPSSLKTSDPKSMMAFMGLPLDLFGKGSFFQPYLPLQQLDLLKNTASWLCGTTNSIVTNQKEVDLLINIETNTFEFRNPHLERSAALTAADRKWMEEIITDVNHGWDESGDGVGVNLEFRGSDDYLRSKFEEYVYAALSTIKYQDFLTKSAGGGVMITGGSGGDSAAPDDFNPVWISEFRKTNAYEVWQKVTDPVIFDIVEPRHPCNEKPSVVADIGLRLQEGIQDLKLEQQLAPAREAVSRAVTVGSANFFKAVEGVRERWGQSQAQAQSAGSGVVGAGVGFGVGVGTAAAAGSGGPPSVDGKDEAKTSPPMANTSTSGGLRPFTLLTRRASDTPPPPPPSTTSLSSTTTATTPATAPPTPATNTILPSSLSTSLSTSFSNMSNSMTMTSPSKNLAAWGSFISQRASTFLARKPTEDSGGSPLPSSTSPSASTPSTPPLPVSRKISLEEKPIPKSPPEPVKKPLTLTTSRVPPPAVEVQYATYRSQTQRSQPQSETQSESQEIEYVPEEEREREVEVEAEIKADDSQDGISRKTSKASGPSINVSTSTPTIGRGGNGTGKDQGRTPTRQMFGPREPRSPPRSPPPPMAAALAMGSPPMTPTLPKTLITSTSFGSGGPGVVSQSPEPEPATILSMPAGSITAAVSIPLPTSPPTSELGDSDAPITTSPQPRARLGRSNTASRRPTARMWEEHNINVLDDVPKGLGRNPWKEEKNVAEEAEEADDQDKDKKQRNPWERHRSGSGSGSGSGGMSSRRSKRNYKDDAGSMYSKTSNSKDDQDHDTEDAYSGMAV